MRKKKEKSQTQGGRGLRLYFQPRFDESFQPSNARD